MSTARGVGERGGCRQGGGCSSHHVFAAFLVVNAGRRAEVVARQLVVEQSFFVHVRGNLLGWKVSVARFLAYAGATGVRPAHAACSLRLLLLRSTPATTHLEIICNPQLVAAVDSDEVHALRNGGSGRVSAGCSMACCHGKAWPATARHGLPGEPTHLELRLLVDHVQRVHMQHKDLAVRQHEQLLLPWRHLCSGEKTQ